MKDNKKESEVEKAKKVLEAERVKNSEGFNKEFAELCEKWNVTTTYIANSDQIAQVFLEAFSKININMVANPKG